MRLIVRDERNGAERVFALDELPMPLTLGRAEDCGLPLPDPSRGISKLQARLELEGDRVCVVDLGKTNRTYLNDQPLPAHRAEPLEPGDCVRIGFYLLEFRDETVAVRERDREEDTSFDGPVWIGGDELFRFMKHVHEVFLERMSKKKRRDEHQDDEDLRAEVRATLGEVMNDTSLPAPGGWSEAALLRELEDYIVGLGPLEKLLADDSVTEVMVNRPDEVYIERAGKLELTPLRFFDHQHIINTIQRIVQPLNRRIDESVPYVDARLKDGSRVHAIIPPLAVKGATITIRKFSKHKFGIEDLVRFGSLDRKMAQFLEWMVLHRASMIISGGTGSGKTTMLNVLSNFIPDGERIITVEDSAELQLNKQHVIALEARPPNIEGKGAITIRDLVRQTLRMRPDRIIVGECRGGEAIDMLQAMNTGHDGSLTTLHANSARDTLSRLETMVMMAEMDLPSRAIREQIAAGIQFVVQTARLADGSRKVTTITEITGLEENAVFTTQDIFVFKQAGFGDDGRVLGEYRATGNVPRFIEGLRERGVRFDMEVFGDV
ncbi:MAG TPA: FHA domain-containing protein [candidate division WOR-3 bacterium]|uniref:FHA domain-containing protein n=1 Tax=candidate division WOR-3 bacterium TaxID=2052148 RepID=A0A7V0T6R2_UNCW3|nr:FHA domain-containing protein [candidate division WOR-3 bacterium]